MNSNACCVSGWSRQLRRPRLLQDLPLFFEDAHLMLQKAQAISLVSGQTGDETVIDVFLEGLGCASGQPLPRPTAGTRAANA
jgi:hypothetical protein